MKETDATNLHSFFVGNLEKAKTLSTSIIDAYILGKKHKRIDLDSRKQSSNFNASVFYNILQHIITQAPIYYLIKIV